jgi:hypothetical protein
MPNAEHRMVSSLLLGAELATELATIIVYFFHGG